MPRYSDCVSAWYGVEKGHPWIARMPHPKLHFRDGEIHSVHGQHMQLAQTLRTPSGGIRAFLLNGDLGSTLTERNQQWVVRQVLQWTGEKVLIVPFQALSTAEIDRTSIVPIEITQDRTEVIIHQTDSFDEAEIRWENIKSSHQYEIGKIPGRPELGFTRQKWTYSFDRESNRYVNKEVTEPFLRVTLRGRHAVRLENGSWQAHEHRHILGDSVFSACLRGEKRRRKFVSSFDYQERWPLYFLAELPQGARVESVSDAILALAPPIVHAAFAQKRDVKRQGDMFAIPTELTTKEVKLLTGSEIRKMQGIFGTDHLVTESVVGKNRATYGRGFIHHRPQGRRPDHQRVALDKIWHLMVPNAVPRRRRGTTARVA